MIGFGRTGTTYEAEEEQLLLEEIKRAVLAEPSEIVTDDVGEAVRRLVELRGTGLRSLCEKYKNATEYPARYSSHYPTVLYDASNVVVILRWLHYHRRHAMSPDGWAVFSTKQIIHFDAGDM